MDSEKLIKEVRRRPVLWNPANKLHNNSIALKAQWEEVANEMGTDSAAVRGKWKNLRDYYRNELKRTTVTKTDEEGLFRNVSVWPYMELMDFLKDVIKSSTRTRNLQANKKIVVQRRSKRKINKCNDSEYLEEEEYSFPDEEDPIVPECFSSAQSYSSFPSPSEKNGSLSPPRDVKKSGAVHEECKRQVRCCVCEEKIVTIEKKPDRIEKEDDDDLQFLKSLLPDIKSLPRYRKLLLRLKFQELVCNEVEVMDIGSSIKSD